MFSKLDILSFVGASFVIVSVLCANNPALIQRDINDNFLNLIDRSDDFMARDSFSSCFPSYSSQINAVGAKYQKDYDACKTNADGQRSTLDSNNLEARNSLANRSETSCAALQHCKEPSSTGEVFQCYGDEGNDNARVSRGISNDAFSQLATYTEQIRVIQSQENICTNKTRETYENDTIAAYNDFNDCILGIVKETSPNPTPDPEPTTTTS